MFELVLFEIFKMMVPHGEEKTMHNLRKMPWMFEKASDSDVCVFAASPSS